VVFEHFAVDPNPTLNPDAVPDLWLMKIDGSNDIQYLPVFAAGSIGGSGLRGGGTVRIAVHE
jgi:hypothetical protein